MSKKRTAKEQKQLTADEFMAKHQREIAEDDRLKVHPPLSLSKAGGTTGLSDLTAEVTAYFRALTSTPDYRLISQLKEWWLVRLLRAAAEDDCPEGYRELLEDWLIRLGVEPPDGVLIPRRKLRGAPLKKSTEEIYRQWIGQERPSWRELAYAIYQREYTAADTKQRKNLRDRCRRAVERHQERLAT
jgi:hypothetical protein